ncbi:hypothetical protein FB451DRAFT_1177324 [Mycena latifolia]|nr:hypothetical protein FB451DRAFT_1177324 [Mycena latifolia]
MTTLPQRARTRLSPNAMREGALKRRDTDADYHERQCKKSALLKSESTRKLTSHRKFIEHHGVTAFFDYYLPEHELQGKKHLPGLRFEELENLAPQAQKMRESKKNKAKDGKKKARVEKGIDYHDQSRRLNYYLVWDVGLFSTRGTAEIVSDADDIKMYLTHAQAEHKWAQLCRRRHCNAVQDANTDDESGDNRDDVPAVPQQNTPMPCSVMAPTVKRLIAKMLRRPALSTPGRRGHPVSLPQAQRGGDTPQQASQPLTSPSVASSPTVSSASSLSTSSGTHTSLGIGESVSSDPRCLNGTEARKPMNPAVAGSSSTAGRAAPSRLLYNNSTQKVYKNAALAMEEMESSEMVQVFDYDDLMDYLSFTPKTKWPSTP